MKQLRVSSLLSVQVDCSGLLGGKMGGEGILKLPLGLTRKSSLTKYQHLGLTRKSSLTKYQHLLESCQGGWPWVHDNSSSVSLPVRKV